MTSLAERIIVVTGGGLGRAGLVRVEATEYGPRESHALYEGGRAMARAQHPDDCVGAVLFLLSPDADFVTGQMLPVNGGFVFN